MKLAGDRIDAGEGIMQQIQDCRIFQDGQDNPDAGWDEYSKWCERLGEFVRGQDEACERFEVAKKD